MSDTVRLIISIILISIVALLGFPAFFRIFSNNFKISFLEAISIVTLLINFLMIAVMVVTIFISNQSSLDQIKSIKDSTQTYINKNEEFNKMTKSALMSALILEYRENLKQTKQIADNWLYLQRTADFFPQNILSFEAYQSNLNNATIDDSLLLEKIVQTYSFFKLFQNCLDSCKVPQITIETRVLNMEKINSIIKENLVLFSNTEREIINYKKTHYDIK